MEDLSDGFGTGPVKMRCANAGVSEPVDQLMDLGDGFASQPAEPKSLQRLNDEQRSIVKDKAKRKLVMAGAGSGKTTGVLLPACDELYRRAPGKIGIFAFGRSIKEELEEKIKTQLDPMVVSKVKVMTNHGLGLMMVKRNLEALGLPAHSDVEGVLWKMVVWYKEQAQLQSKNAQAQTPFYAKTFAYYTDPQIKSILAVEERVIAHGLNYTPDVVFNFAKEYKTLKPLLEKENGAQYLSEYILWARAVRLIHGKLMFRDLLPLAAQLDAEAFKFLGLRHVLIDEAQDLSADQHAVLKKLTSVVETVLWIGDYAQCIFRFSGSRPDLFTGIPGTYGNVETFTMGINYRCDEPILDLANYLLAKVIKSPVRLSPPYSRQGDAIETGEAVPEDLVNWVIRREHSGEHRKDMAVLTRTNGQLLSVELALTKAGISYNCWGGSLFEHKVVEDILAYIRFLVSEKTYQDWETIVSHVKYMGKKTAEESWKFTKGDPLSRWDDWCPSSLKSAVQKQRWLELIKFLSELSQDFNSGYARNWTYQLHNYLKGVWDERWGDDLERLEEAKDIADTIIPWMANFEPKLLLKQIENMSIQDPDGIVLSTAHKFKGLERNSVALWNVGDGKERGLFPLSSGEHEEEACVFYVAVTRARNNLILLKNTATSWPYGLEKLFCIKNNLFAVHGTQNPCITCEHQFSCLAKLQ